MTYLEPGTSGEVNLHITQKNDNQSTNRRLVKKEKHAKRKFFIRVNAAYLITVLFVGKTR